MPYTQPVIGKLGQIAWLPSKMAVLDLFIAPKNTPYDHPFLWTYIGRVSPGSFKNDFTRKFFDVSTGVPETIKESFVTGVEAKLEFEMMELTGLGYLFASGNTERICTYDGANSTTASLNPMKNTIESVEVEALGTLKVTDEIEIDHGNGVKDYAWITEVGAARKANPTTAPTMSTATTGGTVAAGTYRVAYTVRYPDGETTQSTEATQVTTGSTSTITATMPALPAGALAYRVYVSAAGGAAGTAKFQGETTNTTFTLTAPPNAGNAAFPTRNSTGNVIRFWPRISRSPAGGLTNTVKRITGNIAAAGGSKVEHVAVRAIANNTDGTQTITWCADAKVAGGIKDDFGDKKNAALPISMECFSFYDSTMAGNITGKKYILSSDLAIQYSTDGAETQADWQQWTATNIDTTTIPGTIQISGTNTTGNIVSPTRPNRTHPNSKAAGIVSDLQSTSTCTIECRTSNDGVTWTTWTTFAAAAAGAAGTGDYIQYRLTLNRPTGATVAQVMTFLVTPV